jgi:hypothetical protein
MRSAVAVAFASSLACAAAGLILACSSSSAGSVVDDPSETSVTESGAVSLGDAGADDTPFPFNQVCQAVESSDVCGKCGKERCCTTRDAIFATDAGGELVDCIAVDSGCNEACMTDCFARYPQQVRPYLDHFACMSHECLTECASPVNTCSRCLDEQCTLDNLACNLSSSCFLSTACGAACPTADEACLSACAARYPDAARLQTNLVVCGTNRCKSECSGQQR